MTVPISAITAIAPLGGVSPTAATGATSATSGSDFATALSNGLNAVSGAQNNAASLATQAATGTLTDPAQYTIAATQATLMTQMATSVQNKAVTAFNTIMGMQA